MTWFTDLLLTMNAILATIAAVVLLLIVPVAQIPGRWHTYAASAHKIKVSTILARVRRYLRMRFARYRARRILAATRRRYRIAAYMRAEAQVQDTPLPGSYFGLPGVTNWTEQPDNNDGAVQALAQGAVSQAIALGQFKQTDVVFWWDLEISWTNTMTAGTSTITTSAGFPYNIIQTLQLSIQNQYNNLDVRSGLDLALFEMYRPMRGQPDRRTNLNANPAQIFSAAALPQANLDTGPNFTSASAAITFTLELPVSLFFDVYFDLLKDGTPARAPQRAIVSPQYMAGSARVLQPSITFAALSVANLDNGPYNIGAGTGTGVGSVTMGFKRVGIYAQNNAAVMPVIYDWQYSRQSKPFSLAGSAGKDIPIPTVGQILSLWVRLWDPAANGGLGAPIPIANVTKCQVQFGSGLFKFNDTPRMMQRRFVRQHGFLPPQGVCIWDMGIDEFGRVTNAKALNTLTTSGLQIHIDFTGAQSATAYGVLGVEALTFVE